RPADEGPAGGVGTSATARSAPRAVDRRMSSYGAHLHPDPTQSAVHGPPLLPLRSELRPAFFSNPVVLAPAAAVRCGPFRCAVTLALEAMQDRIEHSVGPLEVPARQLGDSLDDRVAVIVAFGKDGEHKRRGRGRNQVLTEVHTWRYYTLLFYVYHPEN